MPTRATRIRGFTLLELLVAVALMAVLSVLCWRGMDAVLRSREDITTRSNETRALATVFAQLDEDLRRSWAVRLFEGYASWPIAFLPDQADGPPMLAILRQGVGEQAGRLQRVFYRLRGGVFERGFGAWSPDLAASGEAAAAALVWQPLLSGIEGIEYRAWVDGRRQWLDTAALLQLPPPVAATTATVNAPYGGPSGVELNLRRGGALIVRVFAVKD